MAERPARTTATPKPAAAAKPALSKPPKTRAAAGAPTTKVAPPLDETTRIDAQASETGAAPATTPRPPVSAATVDRIDVQQGGIEQANAREINVRMGGIGRADAHDIAVSLGGVGLARADRVSVEMGGIGLAVADEARLSQGYARVVLAREARVEQGLVGTMITGKATIQRTTGVFLLVAGRVDGPVKAVLDWRGALAFGGAFGLFWALLRRR